jgi:hypothetical protein
MMVLRATLAQLILGRVLWDRERGAYWRSGRRGHTRFLGTAGLYSEEEAAAIVLADPRNQTESRDAFDEVVLHGSRNALLVGNAEPTEEAA